MLALPLLLLLSVAPTPGSGLRPVTDIDLGASREKVLKVLGTLGFPDVKSLDFRAPGAFAEGILDKPPMLAMLNRASVKNPLFKGLPRSGPSFVVASSGGVRASYAFVNERLWSIALELPGELLRPASNPFDPKRMEPLNQSLRALCSSPAPVDRDEYGNAISWRCGGCSGGTAMIWYDLREHDAALRVVVWGN